MSVKAIASITNLSVGLSDSPGNFSVSSAFIGLDPPFPPGGGSSISIATNIAGHATDVEINAAIAAQVKADLEGVGYVFGPFDRVNIV
jgi:hypothetical protein